MLKRAAVNVAAVIGVAVFLGWLWWPGRARCDQDDLVN